MSELPAPPAAKTARPVWQVLLPMAVAGVVGAVASAVIGYSQGDNSPLFVVAILLALVTGGIGVGLAFSLKGATGPAWLLIVAWLVVLASIGLVVVPILLLLVLANGWPSD